MKFIKFGAAIVLSVAALQLHKFYLADQERDYVLKVNMFIARHGLGNHINEYFACYPNGQVSLSTLFKWNMRPDCGSFLIDLAEGADNFNEALSRLSPDAAAAATANSLAAMRHDVIAALSQLPHTNVTADVTRNVDEAIDDLREIVPQLPSAPSDPSKGQSR